MLPHQLLDQERDRIRIKHHSIRTETQQAHGLAQASLPFPRIDSAPAKLAVRYGVDHGGAPLPLSMKWAMQFAANVMRQTASRV
ncbi:MAG: hypothetical protein WA108_09425 [Thiobacillus sp.]